VNGPHEPNERWDCRSCKRAWPCDEARDELRAEYKHQPAQLAIFMCKMLEYAAPVLVAAGLHPDVMFERFIAWTQRQPLDTQQPT
jgi:hypothetical protein